MSFNEADLTQDAFLGGRLKVWQPRSGYRAGVDPVLLAAACPARAGEAVLDMGCGVGVAGLCLATRVPGVSLTGVERNPDYAALAARNGMEVVTADLKDLPRDLRQRSFDQVIMNPPYFGPGTQSPDAGRAGALHEDTPLEDWIDTARARLAPKGWLTMIHRAEALPRVASALGAFGDIAACPLSPRIGRAARLIVIRARKGAAGPFRLLPPMILHDGATHGGDGDDYSATTRAVLRDGAPLPFG